MKELNLYKIWQIVNTLQKEQDKLHEEDKYIYFLGRHSNYVETNFEEFLNYYSFKIEDDTITIFNDDPIPWESFSNNDFLYVQKELLTLNDQEILDWSKEETEKQLKQIEADKISEKEQLKRKIEILSKRLNEMGNTH